MKESRRPTSEVRKKPEAQSPNAARRLAERGERAGLRDSEFGFLIFFGLRTSCFGLFR